MSSDLLSKAVQNAPATTLAIAPPLSKITMAKTVQGRQLCLPDYQIPNTNANAINTNTWVFPASGNYNTAIANGGIQQIKIAAGQGSGKTSGKVYLRVNCTNSTGASVSLVPAPFLFTNIQFVTPSGDTIQNMDPFSLWISIIGTASSDEWFSLSDLVNSSNNYESGAYVANAATVDWWIPLMGNAYSCGEIPTRVLQGDSYCYVTFDVASNTVLEGTATGFNVNILSLVFEMQQLDNSLIGALDQEYHRNYHDSFYPFVRVMNWTQTWNASSQYTMQLNGITGGVVALMFAFRLSLIGEDKYHGQPITDFQIQNQAGVAISGAQFIPGAYNRWSQLVRWFLGTWMQDRRFYGWSFSAKDSGVVEFITTGRVNGQYGFSGNEQLVIDTAPNGQNEIQTITFGAATTTPGTVWFMWITPYGSTVSTPVAYNANAAAIQAAIEAMSNFEGTVTVSGAFSAAAAQTFNFGGNYANRILFERGFQLVAFSSSATAGAQAASTTVSQMGIDGITNGGTYTLTVAAFTTAIYHITNDDQGGWGRSTIQNS